MMFWSSQINAPVCVSTSEGEKFAVPGDYVIDRLGGERKLVHPIDFDQMTAEENWQPHAEVFGHWMVWRKAAG